MRELEAGLIESIASILRSSARFLDGQRRFLVEAYFYQWKDPKTLDFIPLRRELSYSWTDRQSVLCSETEKPMLIDLVQRARKRTLLALAVPLGLAPLPMQCAPAPWESQYPSSSEYPLQNDFSLSPGLEPGKLTSCYTTSSEVDGREHLCRVVEGYEGVDDFQDWYIDGAPYGNDPIPDTSILAVRGSQYGVRGMTLVTSGGIQYEGCNWISPSNNYRCDYRISRQTVLKTDGSTEFVLRKLWDWGGYIGSTLGCAGGIAGT